MFSVCAMPTLAVKKRSSPLAKYARKYFWAWLLLVIPEIIILLLAGLNALDCLYYAIVRGEKQEKKSFSRFLSNKTTL